MEHRATAPSRSIEPLAPGLRGRALQAIRLRSTSAKSCGRGGSGSGYTVRATSVLAQLGARNVGVRNASVRATLVRRMTPPGIRA
jgi:hypothetical protein